MPAVDIIDQLIGGTYPDPETGELLRAEAKSVVIEDSLAGRECELIEQLDVIAPGSRITVLADQATHAVMGARVEQALRGTYRVSSLVLANPHADSDTIARIRGDLAPGTDMVVAVGTGTLNDLAKMVAHQEGCPQVVFATAPSMNGYTSLSASITTAGVKSSFRTRTPVGVFFDLKILAAAPPRLIRAGLGDSACRSTAQADWLLQHLLLDRPYRHAPFALLASDERDVLGNTAALLAGDLEVMRHLVRTLVLSGFGMTLCNGSYPASQGEHLLSHYVGMMAGDIPDTFHGEQISVCTAAMAALQETLLARDKAPVVRSSTVSEADVVRHFGPVMGPVCWAEFVQKQIDPEALNSRIAMRWDEIRWRIANISVPAAKLRASLAAAGAPVEPSQLGWSDSLWNNALTHAREIRNRYTFLDLAADS